MLPATMSVMPNSPRARQKARTVPASTSGSTTTASSTLRPGKRRRANSHAIGTPASRVSAVALSETRSESQRGKRSTIASELPGEHESEALHDRPALGSVDELDEREAYLRPRASAHHGRAPGERRIRRRVDPETVDLGNVGHS